MSDGRGRKGRYFWPLKSHSQYVTSDCEAAYITIKSFFGLLTERFSGHGRKEREGEKEKGRKGGREEQKKGSKVKRGNEERIPTKIYTGHGSKKRNTDLLTFSLHCFQE